MSQRVRCEWVAGVMRAQNLAQEIQAAGGIITEADLAETEPTFRSPLVIKVPAPFFNAHGCASQFPSCGGWQPGVGKEGGGVCEEESVICPLPSSSASSLIHFGLLQGRWAGTLWFMVSLYQNQVCSCQHCSRTLTAEWAFVLLSLAEDLTQSNRWCPHLNSGLLLMAILSRFLV
jgi:hypothetical protein